MLAAAHGSGSSALATGVLIWVPLVLGSTSLIVGIASFILNYTTSVVRQRLIYGMPVSARLINPSAVRPELHVLYHNNEIADPHVLEIELTYRGRKAIRPTAFEEGQPFCMDVGVPIIELLKTTVEPKEPSSHLKVEAMGTALRIGPSIVRNRQAMKFTVLTDGPCSRLTPDNPLADVKTHPARYQPNQDASKAQQRAKVLNVQRIVSWSLVTLIALYMLADPTAAAQAMTGLLNLLKDAGNSLATFVNSL